MLHDAEELTAKYGATRNHLAVYFNKDISTIDNWIRDEQDFERAVKRGRIVAGLKVGQAFYQRATGYTYKQV